MALESNMDLADGTTLGRYRIEGILGQGQTGTVYRAFDTAIERKVAVKCLRSGADGEGGGEQAGMEAWLDEARVIGQLNHPHVTAVYDIGSLEGLSYIVMEYVEGETLKAKLAKPGSERSSIRQIVGFIVMVARALHYVHQRGILHGDIKPANLMVTPQGFPKIMDFGVARRSLGTQPGSWSLAGESQVWGTPGYLAPEQLVADKVDVRADVFSLGVVTYEWLAGRKPFSGADIDATLKAVLEGRPVHLVDLGDFDPDLSRSIDQALARDPAQRFASADAFADALEVCQEGWLKRLPHRGPIESFDTKPTERFPRLRGHNILFSDFREAELSAVMRMSRQEGYEAGQTILREGEGGSTMYVVVQGLVSVRKRSGAGQVEIKQISRGDCFGEMAVMSQMPRSATVVALEPTEVLAISGAVLRSESPVLCMKLYRNIASLLADRLRHVDAQIVTLLQGERTEAPPV
jgi:serine/threonine-protein kinase